ncbi:recombinase RecA (plasmid) [Acaryochloris sp. 'Moss Beach']|uniref:ATPase domain-containing protein n=1 Tax=Acaryochloris sp. 'Moss Beach' TaxID=2740837 RepID=UPI001BAFDF2E|nr:ATPase domain-containing protein [Acaryochloris sp. 'Moss Beach']QUY40336.1 recombinase RecA [Acaryochloris marina S15]UJB72250.1 recombinase RecA [Acaryochloris sp. 'Moss Beach']
MGKNPKKTKTNKVRISTGISGLDEILQGGLIANRAYLVRGGPGTGKTTLGLHYLTTQLPKGKSSLLICFGEPGNQILESGSDMELDLDCLHCLDLSPDSAFFTESQTYDFFSPAEVEKDPITQKIVDQVTKLNPDRIFVDSMTQFRYITADAFQFRKQVLAFIRFILGQGATVVFTSESSPEEPDYDLQFMSDGVINLELTPTRRTVSISKFRNSGFQPGQHSLRLGPQGMIVFPKLLPEAYKRNFQPEPLPSGIPSLDKMLKGGIERGMVTLFRGASGVGKTTIGLQFMKEAASRMERSVVFTFEEDVEVILRRSENLKIPARVMTEQGSLAIVKIEPLQYTPDEFSSIVRHEVEENNVRIVMLDSISGYNLSMQGEDFLSHLHALCKYLANMGVAVILINETALLDEDDKATDDSFTYLADNLILLRYIDRHEDGKVELRKSIGVIKKRLSDFEKTLRELKITRYGVEVGPPLTGLQGILDGDVIKSEDDDDD